MTMTIKCSCGKDNEIAPPKNAIFNNLVAPAIVIESKQFTCPCGKVYANRISPASMLQFEWSEVPKELQENRIIAVPKLELKGAGL